MKKIIIVISFLCIPLFTDAQLDITKRNVTVTENFWKGGDSLYTASEVDSRITVLEDLLSGGPFAPAVSPVNGHGLIFTDTEGGLFTSPNLRFDESGDGFQYTSTGEYSPTTQGVYFRLDDAFFRYRNNSLLNTDGKYCFVQFDDHKIKYNINNYAPYGPVDFIGDFTINGDLNRIDYHVSNEQADKSIWHIIDSLSYTIQFDGVNSYPYAVPPTYVFNRDTVYFRNKLIVTDTIKTNKGIVFPDGSFQSSAAGGIVSPHAHSLLYTNSTGAILNSPKLFFDEASNRLGYSSDGNFDNLNSPGYFSFDDSQYRFKVNNTSTTHQSSFAANSEVITFSVARTPQSTVSDFDSYFRMHYPTKTTYIYAIDEASPTRSQITWEPGQISIGVDGIIGTPSNVAIFREGSTTIYNRIIAEDTLKVYKGIEFSDGTIQTTATNVDCGNLHVEIYDIREYPSGKQHNTTLGCGAGQLTLKARSNQDVVWEWGDNVMLSDRSADSADIMMGGTYSVSVTNTETGCTATASVEITQDLEEPFVSIDTISLPGFIVLQGLSAIGLDYSYFWHKDGDALYQRGAMVIAKEAGRYELTVENNTNNCTNIHSVYLSEDMFGQ